MFQLTRCQADSARTAGDAGDHQRQRVEDDGGQVSIESTFYAQLLLAQITKAQKTVGLTVFFALLGYSRAKAAGKMLMKLTLVHQEFLRASLSQETHAVSPSEGTDQRV